MTKKEVLSEVKGSKEIIEDKTGVPVESVSYPYAFPEAQKDFTSYLWSAVKNCGYRNGVTTIIGTATRKDNPYFLKRIPANSLDDLRFYRAKVEGGYNWLHGFQNLKKKLGK